MSDYVKSAFKDAIRAMIKDNNPYSGIPCLELAVSKCIAENPAQAGELGLKASSAFDNLGIFFESQGKTDVSKMCKEISGKYALYTAFKTAESGGWV